MRAVFSLIGYLSTATLIAAAAVLLYLWQTEILNDDKMFRMMALLHDVDLEQIASETDIVEGEVPEEEMSLADVARVRQISQRNFEVKSESLERGKQEFEHLLQQLRESTKRFDDLAKELNERLQQQGELSTKENIAKVVRDLELLAPEKSKVLLLRHLEEPNGANDVILLMGQMSGNRLKKILESFETDEELSELYKIHSLMLEGHPQKQVLDEAMQMLKTGEDN